MLFKLLKKNPFIKNFYFEKINKVWNQLNFERIIPYVTQNDKILDIGAGKCALSSILYNKGYNITAIDIKNHSFSNKITPLLFDGKNIPFKNDSFDIAVIVTVLHHAEDPIQILKEAKRVAKKIIIIEDIYYSCFQKYAVYCIDIIMNLKFFGNPHNNMNDNEWKKTFENFKLELLNVRYDKRLCYFVQATYYLES